MISYIIINLIVLKLYMFLWFMLTIQFMSVQHSTLFESFSTVGTHKSQHIRVDLFMNIQNLFILETCIAL